MEKLVLVDSQLEWIDTMISLGCFFVGCGYRIVQGLGMYIYMRTIAWKNTSEIMHVLLYTLPLLCNMMCIYIHDSYTYTYN